MSDTLRVDWVRDLETLDAHADAWDDLAAHHPPHRPTHSHAWVRAFLAHRLAPRETWGCSIAWRGMRLVGVMPLRRRGAHLRTLCDDHTPSGDAVLAADEDAPALLDALFAAHGRFRTATFSGVVSTSPTSTWLAGPPGGRPAMARPPLTGAIVDCARPFDEVLGELSGNARGKLRKGKRLLEGTGPVTFEMVTGADAMSAHPLFLELEMRSWKGKGGTAIAQSDARASFYEDLCARLARRGWLRYHVLRAGDRPVAIEMVIAFAHTWVVHKVAFDEREAKASPGNLVWARTLRAACDAAGVSSVDLLTMDDLMARWGATAYDYRDVTLYGRSPMATLVHRWPHRLKARLRARRLSSQPGDGSAR